MTHFELSGTIQTVIRRPFCRAELARKDQAVKCTGCGRIYPLVRGIIDFRKADVDATAGFSTALDREIAGIMNKSFPKLDYFGLYDLYVATMMRLSGLSVTDSQLKKQREYRVMLQKTHLVHGASMLRKISNYATDFRRVFPRAGVALEDGAGLGQFVDGFARHFDSLLVVDLSLSYLLLTKKLIEDAGLNNVTLLCANVERLPIADGTVNFVHSNNMIEHVTRPRTMIKEAHRVLSAGGLFFILSPNRYSLYFEPHFQLPAFGFIPLPLRRVLVRRLRERDDLDNIGLHSLSELKELISDVFGKSYDAAFLPRRIGETTLHTPIRRLVRFTLESRLLGGLTNLLLNQILLPVMPYHVALCRKDGRLP